jgi:guanine deaminase
MRTPPATVALRGRLLWFIDDPATAGEAASLRQIEDGIVVVADGIIRACGPADEILARAGDGLAIIDHRPHLVLPGLIDAHIHFPQTRAIAAYGAELLEWLERHVFPEELRYGESAHAEPAARFFLDELLANGTTTAAVFCSVHPQSAEALFAEAARRNLRLVAGKVMMDRNAPAALCDTPERGYEESAALIGRWHGRARLRYAISPRFAITSSPAQLEAAGALARAHPDCPVQTHLAESLAEIRAVRRLFAEAGDYTGVYERFGLLGPKSLLGHCIHMSEREWGALNRAGAVAVFCPTSNLFLGSGLFDLAQARDPARPVRVAVATDIGAGTSYSMLATMGEAYKVCRMRGQALDPLAAFHMMTRGNAMALGLGDRIGALEPGREADIVVLDPRATPAMAHRLERAGGIVDELFTLITLGDERAVRETYVMGVPSKPRDRRPRAA